MSFTKTSFRSLCVKGLLAFFLLLTGSLCAVQAQSGFSTDYNIVYAYFLDDPLTSIHLSWIEGDNESQIPELRRKGTSSWNRPQLRREVRIPGSGKMLRELQLRNLRPGSVYEFRFQGSSRVHTFRMLPESHEVPVSFISGGDLYGSSELMTPTTVAAAASNPFFAVIGGDWAYADGNPERIDRWFMLLDIWFKNAVTPEGHIIPFVPVIGNHEVVGGYGTDTDKAPLYFTFFDKPGKRAYYTLDFGEYMSLILLDSNHTNNVSGEQTEWLEDRLSERSAIEHVFPSYHVASWPSFRPFTSYHSSSVRRHWVPVFERNGIRLAFEHHDHTFKRTKPILDGEVNEDGIVYIGDGSWGVTPRNPDETDQRWYIEKSSADHHFWHITIAPGIRVMRALDQNRNVIDMFAQDTQDEALSGGTIGPDSPSEFVLGQNYPNPFNSSTQIRFNLPASDQPVNVILDVFNVRGQRVAELINEPLSQGQHTVSFNAGRHGLSTGVYLYRLRYRDQVEVRKMQLVK